MSDSSTAPLYKINTIQDFNKVPVDRLKICLGEFFDALIYQRALDSLMGEVGNFTFFTWIDDGAENITIKTTFGESNSHEFTIEKQ